MNEPQRPLNETAEVWKGIGLAMLLHLLWIPAVFIPGLAVGLVGIGVAQLIYQVPAAIIYSRKGRKGMMKGIIIGAAITFLLNTACYGIVFGLFTMGR
jgi:hypothetical protein